MFILYVTHFSHKSGQDGATIHPFNRSVNFKDECHKRWPSDCCWLVPGTYAE